MKISHGTRFAVVSLVLGILFTMTGCGPYVPAPKRYSEFGSRLEVTLPKGWLQFTKGKDGYTITRDGLRLEKIIIRTTRIGKKIEGTDRVYNVGMMPNEAADLSVGLIKAHPDMKNFEVEKIDAAELAGQDGYRVDAVYIDDGGLQKRIRMYGGILGKYACEFVFEAADPVYFLKYEPVYQEVISSVRIRK